VQNRTLALKLPGPDIKFFRINGIGLGNILIAWSHAYVFAKLNDYKLVWPTVPQLRLRTLIGEKGSRSYIRYFKINHDYIKKFPKQEACITVDFSDLPKLNPDPAVNIVVTCRSFYDGSLAQKLFNRFEYLVEHEALVKLNLHQTLNEKSVQILSRKTVNAIAVHVRLGDFTKASEKMLSRTQSNHIKWYIEKVQAVRKLAGNIPVILFSDELQSTEIKHFLSLCENVRFSNELRDIDQLLEMSRYKYLVASNSTYSQWASFLGNPHTVYNSKLLWDLPRATYL